MQPAARLLGASGEGTMAFESAHAGPLLDWIFSLAGRDHVLELHLGTDAGHLLTVY